MGLVAVQEIASRHLLLPFRLDLNQLERAALAATDQQSPVHDFQGATFNLLLVVWGSGMGVHQVQVLSAEAGVSARPRLESAQPVPDSRRRAPEVDLAILFLQDRRLTSLTLILLLRSDALVLQRRKGFHQ